MSNRPTRRGFLQVSSAALASTGALAGANPPAAGGEIQVRVTAGSKRFSSEPPLKWQAAAGAGAGKITLDPKRQFQDILGFGAAFTDAACYMLNQLEPSVRERLLRQMFHPSEMALGACRACIGASDYATKAYSYDDGDPDPELTRFSIEHDREYILPVLRQARKINPKLYLLASPWSPPGWMKTGNSMLGGSMRKTYYGPYANYFVKFLQAYAAEGVPVDAITSQNEVDTDQDGKMPACLWGQEYEMEFIARHLGPALERNNIKTKIWILDHNYSLWGRALCELEDPGVNKYVDGVAWHGYIGKAGAMTRVHQAYPDKHQYWTEGGPDYTDPKYRTDWAKWASSFAGILRNWSRCVMAWNLALDEKGRPNIGPFPCGGVVTIDSQSKEITYSGQYWALAHYSRAIRRGAKRIESTGQAPGISHVAASNPDGSTAVVLTNTGSATKVQLVQGARAAEVALPADSVTTLTF